MMLIKLAKLGIFVSFIRYQELRCGLARRNVSIDAERRSPLGKFQ